MAEIEYSDGLGGDYAEPGRLVPNLINWAGALVSLALIGGLVWWGYQLAVRDVTGVPVVRALEGPMRKAPDNPGGLDAEYQGLAVNNIAAIGTAAAPADTVILAPPPPSLAPDDAPGAVLSALAPVATEPAAPAVAEPAAEPVEAVSLTTAAEADEVAPADRASAIEAALLAAQAETAPAAEAGVLDVLPASLGGVVSSIVPVARPQIVLASLAPASEQVGGAAVPSIEPRAIPPGTRLAQLGAFETREIAEREWLAIAERFAAYMGDKSRVIEKAQAGGKVFYRLRAYGFEDLSDARRFCSALLAAEANCIPVVTR